MIGRRVGRAVIWGLVAGVGLAIGLAAGSSLASTPTDGQMLTQLGGGAGGVAALLGLVLPLKPRSRV
ncbi:MAG: hypothetical protein ACRD0S_08005 [Acidimicrobiales bacterium]